MEKYFCNLVLLIAALFIHKVAKFYSPSMHINNCEACIFSLALELHEQQKNWVQAITSIKKTCRK